MVQWICDSALEPGTKLLTGGDPGSGERAGEKFIADLAAPETGFHPSLRVKRMQGHRGIWEMSWAPDGRATFQYGDEVHPGQAHIIWRRVGTHSIFRRP